MHCREDSELTGSATEVRISLFCEFYSCNVFVALVVLQMTSNNSSQCSFQILDSINIGSIFDWASIRIFVHG